LDDVSAIVCVIARRETCALVDDLLLKKKTYALILHSGCMPSKLAI
jgi:hypothetical protein